MNKNSSNEANSILETERASSESQLQGQPGFTKGPWRIREGTSIVTSDHQGDVAIVVGQVNRGTLTTQRSQANARLIAAAPALYEAAQSALTTLRTIRDQQPDFWNTLVDAEVCGTWDKLRAALALATKP